MQPSRAFLDTRQKLPLIGNLLRRVALRFLGDSFSRWLEDPMIENRACRLAEQCLLDRLPRGRSAAILQFAEGTFRGALNDLHPIARVILNDAAEAPARQIEHLSAPREVLFGRNLLERRIQDVCHLPDRRLPPPLAGLLRKHLNCGVRH